MFDVVPLPVADITILAQEYVPYWIWNLYDVQPHGVLAAHDVWVESFDVALHTIEAKLALYLSVGMTVRQNIKKNAQTIFQNYLINTSKWDMVSSSICFQVTDTLNFMGAWITRDPSSALLSTTSVDMLRVLRSVPSEPFCRQRSAKCTVDI